ncbi:MAG: TetR/AcrR family transcriptional regulator [Nitrospirota bacterium]
MTKASETKEKLINAALKLISQKGYLGTTTREIARTAGVTELTLFRRFGSKQRLFEELLARHMFLPALRELLPGLGSLSYEEALRTVATRFLLSLKERKPMVKITHSEINLYPEKIRKVYLQFIDGTTVDLARYFQALQKKGLLRGFAPELAARAFMGMLFSYFRTEEIMKGAAITKKMMERDVGQFVDIFIHGTLRNGS